MNLDKIRQNFLNDVEQHQITVLKDDGIYRHIRFKRPGSTTYYFNLITWIGNLCITGDMGTYVFSCVKDMFTFFRKGKLRINPGYWSEKCLSQSIFGDGIKGFSQELFENAVKYGFKYHVQSNFEDIDISDRSEIKDFGLRMREIYEQIKDELIGLENEHDAISAINAFYCEEFEFYDFWEHNIGEYKYHFLWCLYAIVWGISFYDVQKLIG